jgi:hypothetical protein
MHAAIILDCLEIGLARASNRDSLGLKAAKPLGSGAARCSRAIWCYLDLAQKMLKVREALEETTADGVRFKKPKQSTAFLTSIA